MNSKIDLEKLKKLASEFDPKDINIGVAIGSSVILALISTIERLEKDREIAVDGLERIHSLPLGAFDMCKTKYNEMVTKLSFKIASEALSKLSDDKGDV